jgi:hypothetical protein
MIMMIILLVTGADKLSVSFETLPSHWITSPIQFSILEVKLRQITLTYCTWKCIVFVYFGMIWQLYRLDLPHMVTGRVSKEINDKGRYKKGDK